MFDKLNIFDNCSIIIQFDDETVENMKQIIIGLSNDVNVTRKKKTNQQCQAMHLRKKSKYVVN